MNSPAKEYDGSNKYIRITDIDEESRRYDSSNIVSPDGELDDKYIVKSGDILLARTGASTGKSYLYSEKDGRLYFAGFLIRANVKDRHDPYFIFSSLQTERFKRWVKIMSMRSGQPGINSQEYASFALHTPELKEQHKIANLIKALDIRIEIQNKVIEQLRSLIRALAHNLTDAVSEHKPLMTLVNCSTSALKESDTSIEGKVPVYGASGVCGFVEKPMETKDSILITKDGSGVGTVRYVPEKHSFVGTLASLTAKEGVYLPYVYFALLGFDFSAYKTGLAIPHVYFRDYGKGTIPCPRYEEQVKIAKGLMLYEERLSIEKDVLKKLLEQKSFLLRELFI